MLAGRLDAQYVGIKNCLSECHAHDKLLHDLKTSAMGSLLSSSDVDSTHANCESCHGPGSLAIQGITPERIERDKEQGIKTKCDHETLIDIKNLPATAKSLICLKCHTGTATFTLHAWNMGVHAVNEVSCTDCHSHHAGPELKVMPRAISKMCYQCHQEVQAQFRLPNHHPVPEQRVVCTDCHHPHGTFSEHLLKEETVKETCTRCHAEQEGPFLYEHAETNNDCSTCHASHGSINKYLLTVRMPFLCLQCHSTHWTGSGAGQLESKGAFFTRCTDCHPRIHGTDIPSATGKGVLTQ